ncbi:hypothetical protein GWI33_018163 [Rhynchophorus ferrugineus]|uniref:Glutamate dehydrogenase n=1 Tax=Rhynchophorus ferrugineus TaxID=354439 RepID=A0A834M5M3_RHYFE|nr:hypothetical protein GWI33_018163 [Rhynchophorus ferrugineus]
MIHEKVRSLRQQSRDICFLSKRYARIIYDIPERYQNAFYLANAAFFDSTNWFLHRAYEVAFAGLKNNYRNRFQNRPVSDVKIHAKLKNVINILDQCNSIIDVRFPIRLENGNLCLVRGFRAHYGENIANTPCLGGLRVDENITRDHMKALSVLSAMKNCCMGIGMSGAHGGLKINPKLFSEVELRNIFDSYIDQLFKKGFCGHADVIHPDVNTGELEMKWVVQSYAKCSGRSENASAMGKPVIYGGVEEFDKTAALGALKALEIFMEDVSMMDKIDMDHGLTNKRFIIQGLGKVGTPLALNLVANGAICVGIREHDAYLYDSKGIDLEELLKHKNETAACHKSLVCYIARDVQAKIILEASDGPVTPTAHKILTAKSKIVIPDIYACSGSIIAAYLEYLRNLQQIGISDSTVLDFSNKIYEKALQDVSLKNEKQVASGSHSENVHTIFHPLDFYTTQNIIEDVLVEVGQEIIKNMSRHKLGTDARTAAYLIAIKNIFRRIYKLDKLI